MSLKVALLGNMNNNQFALARYLRDAGVDADLLLFDNEVGHFGPAADTFDLGYQRYCRTLEWGTPMGVVTTPKRTIAADLGPYDVIIGCGPAPAYCERIGRTLDVFVPYGGDLLELTQYALGRPEALHRRWHAVHLQRLGIRRSAIVHMAPCPMFEGRYAQLQPRSERWALGLPMIHLPTYDRSSIERHAAKTHWWSEFQRVREQHDVLLFAHARHVWRCSAADTNHKGTDTLLAGIADFVKGHPDVRIAVVTIESGPDVHASKRRIAELGIGRHVFWFPLMCRKDLMVGLAMADIVCGEFTHSAMSYGVVHEAQTIARPLLTYRDDEYHRGQGAELYPILNARTSDQIASQLARFTGDPASFAGMGAAGHQWYRRCVVDAALARYLAFLGVATEAAAQAGSGGFVPSYSSRG